ncbi:DUF1579 family protein [Paenarthrobacter sp. PH39-S1]|uniref:DUF1579 family protein n=1 Tax=Paenarthrobacter sp. PH39-S1 TaxID=3046204 RepID=UPI0024B95046|nr:DUF1579 family protein [Paenarthrobacter sp. PH39-S1]MDJ0356670.1 DUF1579 family protein [Paenarthrobacter sp. PH39-S1]
MTDNDPDTPFEITEPHVPVPDASLKGLQSLLGSWTLKGHLTGSDEENITGITTFKWLPGGFFLQQDAEINFMGMLIESREIIGYDAHSATLKSYVFSNLSPDPWPYEWEVDGDELIIRVDYGALNATFTGSISTFTGAWAPNPGADPAANVAYEIRSERARD